MKFQLLLAIGAALLLAGCSHHASVSGGYIARGEGFAEFLQLTQTPDGQVLGTLESVRVKPNGTVENNTANVSGSMADQAVTLIVKPTGLFATAQNISGQLDGNAIVLNPTTNTGLGTERFVPADVSAFQIATANLGAQGAHVRQAAQQNIVIGKLTQNTLGLTQALRVFVEKVNTMRVISPIHDDYTKILADAHTALDEEKQHLANGTPLERGQANLARGRINLLGGQLQLANNRVRSFVQASRTHIAELDAEIAQSPCITHQPIQGDVMSGEASCTALTAAAARYEIAKVKAEDTLARTEVLAKDNTAAMSALMKDAGLTNASQ